MECNHISVTQIADICTQISIYPHNIDNGCLQWYSISTKKTSWNMYIWIWHLQMGHLSVLLMWNRIKLIMAVGSVRLAIYLEVNFFLVYWELKTILVSALGSLVMYIYLYALVDWLAFVFDSLVGIFVHGHYINWCWNLSLKHFQWLRVSSGQGKVREIPDLAKVREKSGNFVESQG